MAPLMAWSESRAVWLSRSSSMACLEGGAVPLDIIEELPLAWTEVEVRVGCLRRGFEEVERVFEPLRGALGALHGVVSVVEGSR